jgi:hypothetical protein
MRLRLDRGEATAFPQLDELRAGGGTDYLAFPVLFSDGEIHVGTWTTRRSEGFTDRQLVLLQSLTKPLTRVAVTGRWSYSSFVQHSNWLADDATFYVPVAGIVRFTRHEAAPRRINGHAIPTRASEYDQPSPRRPCLLPCPEEPESSACSQATFLLACTWKRPT